MTVVHVADLRTTVAFWRDKASDIETRYGKEAPVMVNHITSSIRACAEDIEAHIREAERRWSRVEEFVLARIQAASLKPSPEATPADAFRPEPRQTANPS